MNWRVVVTKYARKQMNRFPVKEASRIEEVMTAMAIDPFRGDIAKLGEQGNRWRRRVGSYRILYNLLSEERTIFVYDVQRRTSNTY